jgi:hypothetical protein
MRRVNAPLAMVELVHCPAISQEVSKGKEKAFKFPSLCPVIKLPRVIKKNKLGINCYVEHPSSKVRELPAFMADPADYIAKNIVRKTNEGRMSSKKDYALIYKNLILGVICVFFVINAITSLRMHFHITRGADLFEMGERYVNSN